MTGRLSIFFSIVLLLGILLQGCGPMRQNGEQRGDTLPTDTLEEAEKLDLTATAHSMADSILPRLTLEQKAAQVLMPALFSSDDPYTLKVVGDYGRKGVCGIVLLKGNSKAASVIADSLGKASIVSPIISIDAEWGLGMRLSDEPSYPVNSEIGKTADEEEMFRYGAGVGRQCRELGINMVLGPVVDVATQGSFMGRRSYSDDPVKVSDLAVAYSRGIESAGVMSVAKHFPGHGSAGGDSHKRKPVISRSLHQMDSVDLYPFKKYIEAGLSAVMVGHLAVPAIDPEMRPAAVSKAVVTQLLINDLGFRGLVLTDALNMGGAEGNGADKALEAGADIILAPVNTNREIENILEAVRENRISEETLNEKVKKILFYKSLMKLRGDEKKTEEDKN